MEFKRTKSIKRKFYRVRVSEGDLARIAKIIGNAINDEDNQIDISIESADGEEVFTCHDPDFFRSDEMPREIRSASLSFYDFDEPFKCNLSFKTGTTGSVELSVEGGAQEVPPLVEDLEKALNEKQVFGHALVSVSDKYLFAFSVSLLIAFSIYFVFDYWLNFWIDRFPQFEGSSTHLTISNVGWAAIMLSILTAPFCAEAVTKKLLAPVQFTGQISDPTAKGRQAIFWVVTLVLLPLAVGFLSSALYEIFKLWLTANLA